MTQLKKISLALKRNHKHLVDNLKKGQAIIDDLLSKNVISIDQWERLNAIKEERRLTRELCMCLSLLTTEGFRAFLNVLREHSYQDIALRLDPEENFNSFDQIDAFSDSFKIIDFDVSQIVFKQLDKSDLESRVNSANQYYQMDLVKRDMDNLGRVVIINNFKFDFIDDREGSDKDVELLETLFRKLHFNVQTFTDLTAKELKSVLEEECRNFNKYNNNNTNIDLNSQDYNKYNNISAFILIIMSHGGKDHVYGTDGSKNRNNVNLTEIVELFNGKNCPALVDKPKLIFVQACQADEVESSGDDTHWRELEPRDQTTYNAIHSNVHKMADFFIMVSTVPGEKSLRDIERGTYFIHILCHVITHHCHHWHLLDIMTEINAQHRSVIIRRTSGTILQQPFTKTTMNKKFYFLP